jgi:anti-sigma-K factor RskA
MSDGPDERFDDADMTELGDLIRRARPAEIEWEPPPEDLWNRVAASLEATSTAAPPRVQPTEPADTGTVVPITSGRRRPWLLALSAAAAVVVVVTAGILLTRDGDDERVVSAVELEQLGESGSGRAQLIDRDGMLELRLDTAELDAGDGYLELWLIDPSVTRLVSLGPLRPDGVYDLPPGVDPAQFPIVDVSVEPVDGDPTHSGQSVLRGQLNV